MLSIPSIVVAGVALASSTSAAIFTLTTHLLGSPLDGQVINAAGSAFYLGLPGPSAYCPESVDPNCPNATATVFAGMTALDVCNLCLPARTAQIINDVDRSKPLAASKSMSKPAARWASRNLTPRPLPSTQQSATSSTSPWLPLVPLPLQSLLGGTRVELLVRIPVHVEIMYLRFAEGVLACPHVPDYMNATATYQIYANTPAFNQTDCVKLGGLEPSFLPSGSPPGAWEYT